MDDKRRLATHDRCVSETGPEGRAEPQGLHAEALSGRERDVLELALTGLSARDIADEFSLTEATVRSHLSRIYAKLGVRGRVELLTHMHGTTAHARSVSGLAPDPSDPGDRSTAPPTMSALPLDRRRVLLRIAVVIAILGMGGGYVFAWIRPDLPPTTDLASLSRLVADGRVASLDLRSETLFVVTTDGRRFRADGSDEQAVEAIQSAAIASSGNVSVSGAGDSSAMSLAMFVTATTPVAVLVVAIVLVLRAIPRPPRSSTTG